MEDCKNNFIKKFTEAILEKFCEEDAREITNTLVLQLVDYSVCKNENAISIREENNNKQLLDLFLATKKIEGASINTINRYSYVINKLYELTCMPVEDINVFVLRKSYAVMEKTMSLTSIKNIQSVYCSFFGWLHREGLIPANPCDKLSKIKVDKRLEKPYSPEDLENIRLACKNERDRAIVEFLYATGCRVSEVVPLNITDINFEKRER